MFYSWVFLRIKLSHIFLSLFIIFTLALSPSNSSEIIYENIIHRFWLDIILFENKSALYLLTINIKTILENKTPENTTYNYNIDNCDIYNTQWKKQRLNNSKNETVVYIQKTSCFQTKNSYTKLKGFYIFKKYLYFRYKIKNFRMRVFLPKNAYIPENISLENIGDIGYNRSYLPFYQPPLYSTGERLYTVLTSEIPRNSVIPLEIRFHIKENSYISILYYTIFILLILTIFFIIYIKLKPSHETKKNIEKTPTTSFRKYRSLDEKELEIIDILIDNQGKIFQSELAEILDVSRATVSYLLSSLEKKKIVTRKNAGKRKIVILTL